MNYTDALTRFVKLLSERKVASYAKDLAFSTPPTYEIHEGRRYDKIVEVHAPQGDFVSRSSFCYIERATGNIMAGNWKGVTKPKVARGNIYNDANPLAGTNLYGTDYLRMDNSRFQL